MLGPMTIGALSSGAVEAPSNWWEAGGATGALAVYQPIGAASLAASYVNLANPGTLDAAPGVAPTWASGTGWTFNGTTQYLTTGFVPPASQNQAWLVRFSGASNSGTAMGYFVAASTRAELSPRPGAQISYANGGVRQVDDDSFVSGVIAFSGSQAYKNGSPVGLAIGGYGAGSPIAVYIGDRNGASAFFAGNVQAVAIYDNALDEATVVAVTSAMEAL